MVNDFNTLKEFFKNKKILITGHTGFKGSWLCILLNEFGAEIYGYALPPHTKPNLFDEARIDEFVTTYYGDIRDYQKLQDVLKEVNPEIIIHMAAQALVLSSYNVPRETFEINVMGTVNVLEAARHLKNISAILNVTSDKCYENKEWCWGYREYEPMGGHDPYSSSKGCSELITSSYRHSFYDENTSLQTNAFIASARAGNVIGGGDWSNDRLIPDFVRAISKGTNVSIRNPNSIRPWQHVLEPLTGYLILILNLYNHGAKYTEGWNFGPDESDVQNVEWVTKKLCELWGKEASYTINTQKQNYESNYLKLDSSKARQVLRWKPKWNLEKAISSIVDWNKAFIDNENMYKISQNQIMDYFKIEEK